ncbi:pyroglutamyl-peptidase I [Halanaerobium praevalens]|uniref:Pyrrolidone-carboxylate peptidase n=1 Tax=Halanaerobium praevalens (strain ATCC 33744 / DSM 2228 / GSL) TaxID=572479 RepID=E3DNJ7_HALPG|nr:pyroglutamyl-peptidase I [Halanaerobium praevalens]ADO76535.1 pyroglutamyl-peptidase I [Halanaerobium praevalens DSM 2228]
MKVLVTAFDPFGGEAINPAFEAVKILEDQIAGAEIIKKEIPTVFEKSIEALEKYIEAEKPDITICVGQAGGRYKLSVERVAINVDDARIEDNEGNQPIDTKIFAEGANAYFAELPIKAMVKEVTDHKLPAEVSNTAGTFVCNHLMYGLLYLIDKKYPEMKGGFIHVPFIPEQVIDKKEKASMSLANIKEALTYALKGAVENDEDITKSGGKIS